MILPNKDNYRLCVHNMHNAHPNLQQWPLNYSKIHHEWDILKELSVNFGHVDISTSNHYLIFVQCRSYPVDIFSFLKCLSVYHGFQNKMQKNVKNPLIVLRGNK